MAAAVGALLRPEYGSHLQKYRERGGQPSFHPENTAPYTRRLEALYTLAASDNYVRDMQICEDCLPC